MKLSLILQVNKMHVCNSCMYSKIKRLSHIFAIKCPKIKQTYPLTCSCPNTRFRAALLKIKSTTYKLFCAIFLTTVWA